MLLSLNWLREFVPYEGTTQELGDRLTMLGLECEGIVYPYEAIRTIVVGQIVQCIKHPEADKLSICTVDVGQNTLIQILCGASNIAVNQKVPVALMGTTMPDGVYIKKIKLRGVESFGMICSEKELGLSDEHSGILVLPEHVEVGISIIQALSLDTELLKISITPNRGDCLSVLGIARELSVSFDLPLLHTNAIEFQENDPNFSKEWRVHVSSGVQCPFYNVRCIDNVSIHNSPNAIRYRLHTIGIRSISNVIDVTNYILMELGQPLHVFDKDLLEGNTINVSLAQEGEHIYTLDGQDYILNHSDLIIRDGSKPIALAGIIGCQNSKVTHTTKNILIESALFRPGTIRKTAKRLGISTEASYHFERGIDPAGLRYALNKALQMILHTAGGEVKKGICYYQLHPYKQPIISFSTNKIKKILGISISNSFCSRTLTALGCVIDTSTNEVWEVQIPSWRNDLEGDIDLIEELIRFHGLDTIPEKLPCIYKPLEDIALQESQYDFIAQVHHWACGIGLNETKQYSFISNNELELFGFPNDIRLILCNPLTAEQNVLRTSLIPSLISTTRYNIAHENTGIRLFEVANIYTFDASSKTSTKESMRLGIVMHGALFDTGWPQPRVTASYLDLLGIIEHFMIGLNLKKLEKVKTEKYSFLKPGIDLFIHDTHIGYLGCLTSQIATTCHTNKEIWITELDLETLWSLTKKANFSFTPLSIYPSSSRDITIFTNKALSISIIKSAIEALEIPILEKVVLLDIFERNPIEQKSTFRLYFRNSTKTLTDNEIDIAYKNVITSLTDQFRIKFDVILE